MVNTCFTEDFDRVLYNLATTLVVYVMCFLWEPIPYVIWSITITWLKYLIVGKSYNAWHVQTLKSEKSSKHHAINDQNCVSKCKLPLLYKRCQI